jgi:multicomponent Na+:H+ antiporter subunit D
MLSGAVVKAGVLPLVRCALLVPEVDPLIRGLGSRDSIARRRLCRL